MAANEDRYQKIRVRMWRGETVPRLSRDAKLLWVYLLSSPDTTMIPGLLSVGVGSIADDLGYSFDEVRAALAEIEATGEVHFDPAGLVWFRKALQHNPPDSPNHVKGWRRHWSEVRTCALKDVAWTEIRSWLAEHRGQTFVQPFDLVCPRPVLSKNPQNRSPSPIPSGNPSRTQEQYQEQKQNQETQSAGAGAPAYACTPEAAPDTSLSGRVIAEVVSTEPPPSRLPPAPVEVVASSPSTGTAPPSHATGPLAASGAEDDDQPPPAQRCPSTPRPEPVAAVAPAAPVEAAPTVAPALPVAVPSAPVASAAPSEQLALVPPAEAPVVDPVVAVFNHWRETVWKGRAVLNDRRRSRIAARIAEGYSVDDLKRVADGVLRDDWLMGRADGARSEGWRDVETVYRDAAQVERLIQLAAAPPGAIRPRAQRAHHPANVAPPQPRDPGKIISPFGTVMTFDDDEDDAPAPPRGGYRMASGDAAGGAL